VGKRRIQAPPKFTIGMPVDAARAIINKRRRLKVVKVTVLNKDEIKKATDPIRGQYRLSNGTKLIFERSRGPTGRGTLCYRIVEIKTGGRDGQKATRKKTVKRRGA
jgi:hypothetical protein